MNDMDRELIFKDEVYHIAGAAMEVSNHLGCGFLEAVYQEAMEMEFSSQQIPFEAQKQIRIFYKGRQMMKEYVADFVCYGQIVVEIKSIKVITGIEEAQLLNYLKATQLPLGLIINFGAPKLEWKRYINTKRNRD